MHRFFIPPQAIQADTVRFDEKVSHQITQVLRLKPETLVTMLDGSGMEFEVRLVSVTAQECQGEILSRKLSATEPKTFLTLYLCLTQREKFEWMLQKCTEVGACRFVPVISSRTLVQDPKEIRNKLERWQRIIQEAAEQSHRGRIPILEYPLRFEEAADREARSGAVRLIPWEDEKATSLRQGLISGPNKEVVLLIGPEGGFSKEEIATAKAAQFIPVTLGKRILRMETAAVVASALVLYELGEMNEG